MGGRGVVGTWALVLQVMRLEESPAQLDLINLTIFAVGQKTRNVQLYAAADGTAGLPHVTAQLTSGPAQKIYHRHRRPFLSITSTRRVQDKPNANTNT